MAGYDTKSNKVHGVSVAEVTQAAPLTDPPSGDPATWSLQELARVLPRALRTIRDGGKQYRALGPQINAEIAEVSRLLAKAQQQGNTHAEGRMRTLLASLGEQHNKWREGVAKLDWAKQQLTALRMTTLAKQLGAEALPLIPVAVVVGIIVLAGMIIRAVRLYAEARLERQAVAQVIDGVASGAIPPGQGQALIEATTGGDGIGSSFFSSSPWVMPASLAVGALILLKILDD